jgi:MFS transporter, DHA1 family, staphyloferrin A biosynthesis exporter
LKSIGETLPALRERTLRRYLFGQFCSVLGSWTQNITLSLLMWQMTHSAPLLGVMNFLLTGPMLVLPLWAGSRLHPSTVRRDTLRILSCSCAVALGLFLGAVTHVLSAEVLLVAAVILGVIGAFELPARQLLLTSALSTKVILPNAVAMNTLVYNVGRMVGPAVAALVFPLAGEATGFAVNACGLVIMLWCVGGLGLAPSVSASGAGVLAAGALRNALAFARSDPFIRRYLPVLVGLGLFVGSYQTMIPVLAARQFGSATTYTGLFFGCAGTGSFCAAALLSTKPSGAFWSRMLANAPWWSAAALGGVAVSRLAWVTGLCFWMLGLSLAYSTTRINATMQRRSPAHFRGATVGLYAVSFLGTMPLGHLLVGTISGWIGPRWTFAGMAVCLTAVQAWTSRRGRSRVT